MTAQQKAAAITMPTVRQTFTVPSLQRRLSVLLLLAGILPTLLMGGVATYFAASTLETQIGNRLDDIASTTTEKIDRVMFDRVNDVQTFASTSEARSLDPEVLTTMMNNLVRTYSPLYVVMIAADRQGTVRAVNTADEYAYVPDMVGHSVANEPWFRVWLDHPLPSGQSFVSDVYVEPLLKTGDPESGRVIALSYPIRNERGMVIGVWSAFLDWNVIRNLINDSLASPRASDTRSAAMTLISKDGLVLMSPDRNAMFRETISLSEVQRQHIFRRTIARDEGRTWFRPDLLAGTALSHGYSSYRGLGWIAIATAARDEALAPVRRLWTDVLVVGALVAVGVLALGMVAGRAVARPVTALTVATERAAQGDLTQQVPISSNDEIGKLGNAFNHMIGQLNEARQTLEARIAERTATLQSALETLHETFNERDMLSEQLRQSSIPLIPLVEQIAVLPVVGALDSDRIQQLQLALLHGIERERLRAVLLDITAVPIVDTQVARGLIEAARAAKLLGCRVNLVGIRPEVAQTIVQLGVSFPEMGTYATLQAALIDLLAHQQAGATAAGTGFPGVRAHRP